MDGRRCREEVSLQQIFLSWEELNEKWRYQLANGCGDEANEVFIRGKMLMSRVAITSLPRNFCCDSQISSVVW